MALLLVGATSASAATIWGPATSSVEYGNNDFVDDAWSSGQIDLTKLAPGYLAPLTLTLSFTTKNLVPNSSFSVGGTTTSSPYVADLLLPVGTSSWTKTYDVVGYDPAGIYFTAFLSGPSSATTWTLTSATLSDSKPATTPIPAAGLLLGSGLLGLFGIGKARLKKD